MKSKNWSKIILYPTMMLIETRNKMVKKRKREQTILFF